MARQLCFFALVMSALLLPSLATAQAPPATKTPVAPKADQIDPNACAQSDTQGTVGKGAGAESHRQDGKDEHIDPEIKQPTPPTGSSMPVIPPPGSSMPVIPPPGSPGGDQSVQPK